MTADDADLLRRYADTGEEDAFAELVKRYIPLVYSAALRQLNGEAHHAEDVTQKVFSLLAHKAGSLTAHHSLAGWLHATTRFAAKDILRAERRRRVREQEAYVMHQLTNDSDSAANWEQLRPVIDETLGELSERDREAVLLRFFAGLPLADVGARLNLTENTARMRVDRALDRLRTALARRGLSSTSVVLATALGNQVFAVVPPNLPAAVISAALTGTTTTASAATLLTLMSLTKIQIGIAVMVALAVGAAIYEADIVHQQNRKQIATENDRAALSRQVSGLERRLSDVRGEQIRLASTLAERRARLKSSPPVAGGAGVSDSQLAVLVQQIRVRQTLERNNPEFQRLQREVGQREISRNYGPFYQKLGLSPAQIQRFEAAMAEHQGAIADIEAVAQIRGSPDSAAEKKQLEAAANEQLSLALREVFGAEDYPRFERYRESTNVRCNVIDWLAGALYATATPLDRAQAEELTQILVHNTTVEDGRANSEAINWDTTMSEARRVLSAAQFSALEAARAQNEWTKVFYQAINAAYHQQAQEKSGG